jgi:hypothetical protein
MQERLPSCRGFVIPRKAQRSTAKSGCGGASGYVFITISTADLTIHLGSTGPHNGGQFLGDTLLARADRRHAGYSAVSMTSTTNLLSQTTMDLCSMTPADSSPAAKKS